MRRRVFLIALAALAGFYLLLRTGADPNDTTRVVHEAKHASDSPNRRETTRRRTHAELSQKLAFVAATMPARPSSATRPAPLNTEELAQRANEAEMLTTRWLAQTSDADWSDRSRLLIIERLAGANLPASALRDLDCRDTICRCTLVVESADDALKALAAARDIHDETWLDHREDADETWQIDVFFSRPGYRLSGDGSRIAPNG